MRLKNLLTFLVLLSVSLGMRAADYTWTQGDYQVVLADVPAGSVAGKDTYQKITVNSPGALAAFMESTITDSNNPLHGLGGNPARVNLQIEGELNANDLKALNSTDYSPLATFTSLDLKRATIEITTNAETGAQTSGISGIKMSNLKYLRLPSNFNTIESMNGLSKDNNPNLEVALSTDKIGNEANKVVINSFKANGFNNSRSVFIDGYNGGNNGFYEAKTAKYVTMSGEFGDKDLYDGEKNFDTPAVWDFTGANFAPITLSSYKFTEGEQIDGSQGSFHYSVNDPFKEKNTAISELSNHDTNSFYYFLYYAREVVDIKLPTEITSLPPLSLGYLGASNKANYQALTGMSNEEFTQKFSYVDQNGQTQVPTGAPIENLTIPNNYIILDYECGVRPNVKHIVVGNGVKEIRGGAFVNSTVLSDLDFVSGINNCKIGDLAFGESHAMKHIALSEGIVSIGVSAFDNSHNLESIRLPQTLLYIGDKAFNNCLALNSITIPENVDKIGKDAFRLCPLTDIYLTTTDPNKIPLIFTGGNTFQNWGTSSFYNGHYNGWTQLPSSADDKTKIEKLTWEEAVEWYFIHCNGIPVLHYPKQLAKKVRSYISTYYHAHSKDGKGLPMQSDMNLRATADGANVGTSGQGRYTRDGWAQFMLMEEYDPNTEDEVYSKEYDDVWYTMCFPFDLTDEQLAAAFNETFNIVDFSGVEIRNENNGTKNLVLHFNTVALTTYKDNDGNIYQRKMSGGKPIREVDTDKFEYNVYLDKDGNEYHHSIVSEKLGTNKTKTFARGSSMAAAKQNKDNAIVIDGILAEAGHPYMIHPAIGVNTGEPMKRCYFSGIKWLDNNERAAKYEERKRVVNLSVGKGTVTDDMKTCVPSEDNYLQREYSTYPNQTYTFKGNYKVFKDGTAESVASVGEEPVVPKKPEEPTRPDDPDGENSPFTAEDKTMPSEQIPDPVPPAPTQEQRGIYYLVTSFWGIYDEITCNANQSGNPQWDIWNSQRWELQNNDYGINVYSDAGFETCKEAFNITKKYVKYEKIIEQWNAYNAYIAAKDAYQNYNPSTAWTDYTNELNAYNTALENHQKWENKVGKYKPLIPTGAYFLGRRGRGWPKFYREIADDTRTNPTGGFWTQYTAIIEPNSAAIAGIEHELDAGIANNTKGLNMVFDEGFMGEFEANEIKEIVAEAEEKGQKVEYMNIVYSINGEVVGRGSHSLSNLPQGMYIINGKKYLVK